MGRGDGDDDARDGDGCGLAADAGADADPAGTGAALRCREGALPVARLLRCLLTGSLLGTVGGRSWRVPAVAWCVVATAGESLGQRGGRDQPDPGPGILARLHGLCLHGLCLHGGGDVPPDGPCVGALGSW